MAESPLRAEAQDGVGQITICRPRKRNALSRGVWQALPDAIDRLARNPAVSAIALCGEGEHFSAGADLQDVLAASENLTASRDFCTIMLRAMRAMQNCPIPTIAAIRGNAVGAGFELALCCDLRIAERTARIALPFAYHGVVPFPGSLRQLVALVGDGRARQVLLSAKAVDAPTCLSLGLIEEVVEVGDLDNAVRAKAAGYASHSRYSMQQIKRLLQSDEGELAAEIEPTAQSLAAGDVRASALRFLNKQARPI